jgi:hypothetical protein
VALITDLAVILAAGDTVVLAHGLTSLGASIAPTSVLPDRSTLIRCTASDSTTVTFRNDGVDTAAAIFRCMHIHSEQAQDSLNPLRWQGDSGTGTSPVQSLGSVGPLTVESSTTDEQVLAQIPIAAGVLDDIGKTLRFCCGVRVTAADAAATTVRTRVRLGGLAGTLMADFAAVVPNAVNKNLVLDLTFRVQSTGVAGLVDTIGVGSMTPYGASSASGGVSNPTGGPIANDLTVARDLTVTIEFSAVTAPTADNVVLLDAMTAEIGG